MPCTDSHDVQMTLCSAPGGLNEDDHVERLAEPYQPRFPSFSAKSLQYLHQAGGGLSSCSSRPFVLLRTVRLLKAQTTMQMTWLAPSKH